MLDTPTRLRAILASYQAKRPKSSEVELLSEVDTELAPLLMEHIEFFPATKETLTGYLDMIDLIDQRVAELGHPELSQHERIQKGKAYLRRPDTGIAEATNAPEGVRCPLKIMEDTRLEVWKQILSKVKT